jgi:hypothetical protein
LYTRRLVAALAFAVSACTTTTPLESTTSTIVVHSVLSAAQDDQIVAVQRTTQGVPVASSVDSATVTISGPDGIAMTGVEGQDSSLTRVYRVTLSKFHEQLTPGGTYHLHVRLKTGEEVTGTTTIPNAQPVLPPIAILPFNEVTAGVYALFADTSVVLPGTMRSFNGTAVFANGLNHTVVVSAVDANYYQYYRTTSDPFSGATVQGNLWGAEGVFGSLVIVAVRAFHVATTMH